MLNFSKYLFQLFGKMIAVAALAAAALQGSAQAQSPVPIVFQISPDSLPAGSPDFTLTVMGAQFDFSATVQWNGIGLSTSFLSEGTLMASVPSAFMAVPDFATVTVVNSDGISSNSVNFTISIVNSVPVISDTNPASALAGGPGFDITIYGAGFSQQSRVLWNQDSLTTYYFDNGTLVASVPANEIANPNTALITVLDTATGAVSDAQRFVVTPGFTLYFPQVAVGGGYTTVFRLINHGAQSTGGTLTLTAQDGSPFNVASPDAPGAPAAAASFAFVIPGGGTQTITVVAPNAGDPVTSGWAHVDSDNGNLSGEAIFEASQGGVLTSVAGVLPAPPENSVTIPVDNDAVAGRKTGIAIANHTGNAVNISMVVLDENGVAVENISPPQLNPLAPGQQVAEFVDQFLPGRATFRGSLVLSGNSPDDQFVSVALLINAGANGQGLMSTFPVDPLKGTVHRFSTTYFPQVAVGGPYSTTITVLNAGTREAVGSLTLNDQSGNALTVSGAESDNPPVIAATFTFVIPAGGSRMYTFTAVDPSAPVMSGWARVDSDSNMVTGVATFQTTENNMLTSIAGVLPTEPAPAAVIPIDNDAAGGRRTGFALANGGLAGVNVQIVVLDENGNQVDAISPPQLNPLGPGQQIAKFLDEFMPGLATFRGSIKLVGQGAFDQFESLALQLTPGPTGLGLMTVVPVIQ
jgi:hypothetical protein